MKRATCKCMGTRMHKDRYIGTLVKMYLVLVCFVLILAEKPQQGEKFILEVWHTGKRGCE